MERKKKPRSERVRRLVDEGGYIRHWLEGKSPKEIAMIFGVAPWTVYHHLQEIADKNGYTRNQLLEEPEHSVSHTCTSNFFKQEKIAVEQLNETCEKLEADFNELIGLIDKIVNEEDISL